MYVLKYFKNIPRSPPIERQALSVIFFSSNSQRGPWQKKKACRPPNGRQGPVARWAGDRVPFPLCRASFTNSVGSSSREAIEERGYPSMHGVERVL